MSIVELDRFIQTAKHPTYKKTFRAVAVVDAAYVDDELVAGWTAPAKPTGIWVVSVADLQARYTNAFDAALNSLAGPTVGLV